MTSKEPQEKPNGMVAPFIAPPPPPPTRPPIDDHEERIAKMEAAWELQLNVNDTVYGRITAVQNCLLEEIRKLRDQINKQP